MKKLRVAVIGCGRICIMHFDAIANIENVELVACCDIVKSKADFYAKKYNVKAYYDYKEMLDNEKLDSIHICLPHYLHTIVAEYAFSKGVNVLSEKPMSIDYQSAVNAVECAKKNNVQYGIIFQCRYNNSIRKVKNIVESGKLGRIISANAVLTWKRTNEYYTHSDWIGTWDKEGGGVIINQAIHTVDLVNWIVDSEIKKVNCSLSNYCNDIIAVEDTAEGCVEYKNGTRFTFYFTNNYACDEPIQIKLFCERRNVKHKICHYGFIKRIQFFVNVNHSSFFNRLFIIVFFFIGYIRKRIYPVVK